LIIPCIDLMDRKVVQLVQGREKALEGDSPLEMLRRFSKFPEIQVIDLDAAIGNGSNDDIVRLIASHAKTRIGGGVRSAERAAALGFEGKWAIHPSQLEIANEVFSPSKRELSWAREIFAKIQSASAGGDGAFGQDGVLIDLAVLKRAQAILDRQQAIEQASAARSNEGARDVA